MKKNRLAFCAGLLIALLPAFAAAKGAQYVDLTANFAHFVDETAGMEEAARVSLFRQQMDALLPGFYTPRSDANPADYDARVAQALADFAALRPAYERTQKDFAASFKAGIAHFRKVFPGFTPNVPVYLLHSIGEMDGGTRTLHDQPYLIFGADVIARIHDAHTLTPFLDHELFHVENRKYFEMDCEEVWCSLWAEGLATYAAEVMNPGADDRQLLLTMPKPIRAAVDAKWPAALCFTRARLSSTEEADLRALFYGGPDDGEFPRRFGYYVGLRVIEQSGGQYGLPELARMKKERAKEVLAGALDSLVKQAGGCQ